MNWIDNKHVVITGATSGLGKEAALQLASLGAIVTLACRDEARAHKLASEINATGGDADVIPLDTSDQGSIHNFASAYQAKHRTLDVLINNAGTLLPERCTSVDCIELTFATNVLGYHLVLAALLEALRAAESARVINVASTFAFGVDLDDLQFERRPYDGMTAYAQSKACNRMLTWASARRLEADSITVNAVAPGLVLETELYRHLPGEAKRELEQYGTRSITEGAETLVWLASSSEIEGLTGAFLEQRAEIACEFRGEEEEERLWQVCELLMGRCEHAVVEQPSSRGNR